MDMNDVMWFWEKVLPKLLPLIRNQGFNELSDLSCMHHALIVSVECRINRESLIILEGKEKVHKPNADIGIAAMLMIYHELYPEKERALSEACAQIKNIGPVYGEIRHWKDYKKNFDHRNRIYYGNPSANVEPRYHSVLMTGYHKEKRYFSYLNSTGKNGMRKVNFGLIVRMFCPIFHNELYKFHPDMLIQENPNLPPPPPPDD
ncbi:hypothetical protein PIB30_098269 [Stylosanthes scabra]|uniref:Uncharacterized protein n=1 Tax=Stylosanthes scabra TaxID=79078 RepID=A0ABU6UWR9_9FABA|nr:hypothetical protein [Stylosanthes scabra]